jgi:phosphoribosyl-AMP cyclohydrolase / phosphoribosyl-ATP pyrophosphohydrolase
MAEELIQNIRFDERGLIPAIVLEAATREVITLCFMDNAALVKSLRTGRATFFNPPDSSLESPYKLLDIRMNLDGDSLTVLVEREAGGPIQKKPASLLRDSAQSPKASGPAVSLVNVESMEFGLAINNLYELIAKRKETRPEGSYTTYLFNSGLDKILKKVAEEAGEVIVAAKNTSHRDMVCELADLFYHLLVLMVEREIKLSEVHSELAGRAAKAPKKE